MSNFWNDVKSTFSGQGPGPQPPLDEAGKAIWDIENKKHAITQASHNEQNAIMGQINEEYRKIGESSYTMNKEGSFELNKLTGFFEAIDGLNIALAEKEEKLADVLSRYDEELAILRPPPPPGQALCPNCGALYIQGETIFCGSCGYKLMENNADAGTPEAAPAQQVVCSGCNATLAPGSAFCPSCGNKA